MSNWKKFISFLIAAYAIINVYASPIKSLGIADFIMVLLSPFLVVTFIYGRSGNRFLASKMQKSLFALMAYIILVSFFNAVMHDLDLKDICIRLIVEGFYAFLIIYFISSDIVNVNYMMKTYRSLTLISCLLLLCQVVMHYLFNYNLYFLIRWLRYSQASYSTYDKYSAAYNALYMHNFRPTSVFLEPSHFALYVGPCLLLCLSQDKVKRKDFVFCILISISLVFCDSGNGMIFFVIGWGSYMLRSLYQFNRMKRINVLLLSVIPIGLIFLVKHNVIFNVISRIRGISKGMNSSLYVRLLKGFDFYAILEPASKLLGIGSGAYTSYVIEKQFDLNPTYEYMSSVSYILVSAGILGIVLFVIYNFNLGKLLIKAKLFSVFSALVVIYFTTASFLSARDFPLIVLIVKYAETLNHKRRTLNYEVPDKLCKQGI